jgi:hypothetical protein
MDAGGIVDVYLSIMIVAVMKLLWWWWWQKGYEFNINFVNAAYSYRKGKNLTKIQIFVPFLNTSIDVKYQLACIHFSN